MIQPKRAHIILLVDDEQVVRSFIRLVLQKSGYSVLEASDGAEALLLFDKHRGEIDLLLTDVVMPGIGGVELARQVVSQCPEVPVVFISAYCDVIPKELNRHGCVPKPFGPAEIIARVAEIVPKPVLD